MVYDLTLRLLLLLLIASLRLIWHYICRENALLRLFAFDLERSKWAEQLVHTTRCLIMTLVDILLLVSIHCRVHMGRYNMLLDLRTLLTRIASI